MKFRLPIALAALALTISLGIAQQAVSTIDPTLPTNNSPLISAIIRQNFIAAYNDINYLLSNVRSAGGTNGQFQVNNNGFLNGVTIGGDLTINGTTGVATIANGAVTAAKMATGAAVGNIGYTPVNKAGDTMTGPLVLPADPTSGLQAATKQYVDNISDGYTSIFNWIPSAQQAAIRAGTSTYDATSAIQTALNTGVPLNFCGGTFNLTDHILLAAGQYIKGCGSQGVNKSVFHMTNAGPLAFNMTRPSVLQLNHFVDIRGIGFIFDQPDSTSRADMTQYPAAIGYNGTFADQAQTVILDDILIARAWTCLNTSGNITGTFSNIKCGAFNQGWIMDGAADWVRGSNIEFWWYGMSLNQQIAAANNQCMDIGEGPYNFTNIQAWYCYIHTRAGNVGNLLGGGSPLVTFSGLALDTSYLYVSSGSVTASSVYGTKDGTAAWATGRHNGWFFLVDGGSSLSVSGFDVLGNGEQIAYNSGGQFMSLDNGVMRQACTSCPIVQNDTGLSALGSSLILSGYTATTRTVPAIQQNGGGISANAVVDRTTAPGPVAYFSTDDARNFIEPKRYKGMNGGVPISAGFTISSGNAGSYQ